MLKEPKWPSVLHQGERNAKGGPWFLELPDIMSFSILFQ